MGRWTSNTDPFGGHHVIELESRERYMLGDEADPDIYQEFVDDITKRHNADCAAYEATIAELTFDRDSEKRWACQYKAERDAANAQVAELARQTVTLQQDRDTANQRVAELEAFCIDNTISVLQGKLSALTATLERLREVVQSDEWIYAKHTDDGQMERIEAILYPQPQPPEQTP